MTLGILEAYPGRHWAFYLSHGMAVALLASHTDISMAGSADVVPPGCPCSILLYWGCASELLSEQNNGQWLMVDEMEVRCLNWQKCLVYISEANEKHLSPFRIQLKCLNPEG